MTSEYTYQELLTNYLSHYEGQIWMKVRCQNLENIMEQFDAIINPL
jgi:hypothetical protein